MEGQNGPVVPLGFRACYMTFTGKGPVAQLVERGAYTFVYTYSILGTPKSLD